jgi:ketosteroid isomerase-like protein
VTITEDNLTLVRRAYAAWNCGDVEALLDCYREDVEIYPFLSDLGGRVYRGHEGVRRWYADANEAWDRLLAEPEEISARGDDVVILVHARGHGLRSGIDVDAHIVHVALIEDGRLRRLEGFGSEQDARRALGERWPQSTFEQSRPTRYAATDTPPAAGGASIG